MDKIKVIKMNGSYAGVTTIDPSPYVDEVIKEINRFYTKLGYRPWCVFIGAKSQDAAIESPLYILKNLRYGRDLKFESKIIVLPNFNGVLAIPNPSLQHWNIVD